MPTVYEDLAAFGLEPVGELHEVHIYEELFCYDWRLAVWRYTAGYSLWYAIENKSLNKPDVPSFSGVKGFEQLYRLAKPADFAQFKLHLNGFWAGRSLAPSDVIGRNMRNRRRKFQRKVGRMLFASPYLVSRDPIVMPPVSTGLR